MHASFWVLAQSGNVGTRWRYDIKTLSALVAFCEGKRPFIPVDSPFKRSVMCCFDKFPVDSIIKLLNKESGCPWIVTPWRLGDVTVMGTGISSILVDLSLLAGKSPVTGEFPAQVTSNAENFSIWWRHQVLPVFHGVLLVTTVWIAGDLPRE